ncbi:hypothetical protein K435DRAFT_792192 [Dendrothele bispora CBS 962.96]|uniref:Uncharacterized protein n=1 Tax=Dendrothele bispora (strain CBS 962.96) TaxID=1314807 RepID=A0A4S8ML61_DENBC|nr:hypothetical protein K435DRAFT_792192 [Dendrothele bispora CBS 962.96]
MPPRKRPPTPPLPGQSSFQLDLADPQLDPVSLSPLFSLNEDSIRRRGKAQKLPGQNKFTSTLGSASPSASTTTDIPSIAQPDCVSHPVSPLLLHTDNNSPTMNASGVNSPFIQSSRSPIARMYQQVPPQTPQNFIPSQTASSNQPVEHLSPLQLAALSLNSPEVNQDINMEEDFINSPVNVQNNDFEFFAPSSSSSSHTSNLWSPLSLESGSQEIRGSHQHLMKALDHLRLARLSLTRVILNVLESNSSGDRLHLMKNQFFREDHNNLEQILDAIWKDERGRVRIQAWMLDRDVAAELVEKKVSDEFENAKSVLSMKSSDVSLNYVENWDVSNILNSAPTPLFTRILHAAIDEGRKNSESEQGEGGVESSIERIKIHGNQVPDELPLAEFAETTYEV